MAKEITKIVTDKEGTQVVETVTKAPMSTRKKVGIGVVIALGIGVVAAAVTAIFGNNAEPDTEHNFCTASEPEYEPEENDTEEE